MARQKKSAKSKTSNGVRRTPSPLRSTSGAGFAFEDLISAWLQVKMLTGEQVPAIGGTGTRLQAQVSALGWRIDDLLITTQGNAGTFGRLAVSVKGNLQVSTSGLPEDFVKLAWEQWRAPQGPMIRSDDGLAHCQACRRWRRRAAPPADRRRAPAPHRISGNG